MGRTRRAAARCGIASLAVVWQLALFAGCGAPAPSLSGAWSSVSISHPSPFFAGTLPDSTPGSATVVFDGAGGFVWRHDDTRIEGTVAVQGPHELVMTSSEDAEATTLRYELTPEGLVMETDDGFVFRFQRADGG